MNATPPRAVALAAAPPSATAAPAASAEADAGLPRPDVSAASAGTASEPPSAKTRAPTKRPAKGRPKRATLGSEFDTHD